MSGNAVGGSKSRRFKIAIAAAIAVAVVLVVLLSYIIIPTFAPTSIEAKIVPVSLGGSPGFTIECSGHLQVQPFINTQVGANMAYYFSDARTGPYLNGTNIGSQGFTTNTDEFGNFEVVGNSVYQYADRNITIVFSIWYDGKTIQKIFAFQMNQDGWYTPITPPQQPVDG